MTEFTEIQEIKSNSIRQKDKPQKGFLFWFTRWAFLLLPEGKQWFVIAFYSLYWIIIMPFFFLLDVSLFTIIGIVKLIISIVKKLWKLFLKLFEKLFTGLIYPTIAFTLKIIAAVAIAIILIFKFDFIKETIMSLLNF